MCAFLVTCMNTFFAQNNDEVDYIRNFESKLSKKKRTYVKQKVGILKL